MKKNLLVIISVLLIGCISVPTFAEWKEVGTVDEFGDSTGDSVLKDTIKGTFTNSATEDAELTVEVGFQFNNGESGQFTGFSFKLLEYGDNPADFWSDDIRLYCKIDDEKQNFRVFEGSNAGTLVTSTIFYGKRSSVIPIAKALAAGNEVKCYIEDRSTKYSFTLSPDGFADWYKPAMYEYAKEFAEESMNSDLAFAGDIDFCGDCMDSLGDYEDAKELAEEYEKKAEELRN